MYNTRSQLNSNLLFRNATETEETTMLVVVCKYTVKIVGNEIDYSGRGDELRTTKSNSSY